MIAVYKITSKLSDELLYVGSSIKYKHRVYNHLYYLRIGTHKNNRLQMHFNTMGESDLCFSVIEEIKIPEILLSKEQFYLDTMNPMYNECPIAGNKTDWKASQETCDRIRSGQPKKKAKHRFGQAEKSIRMKGKKYSLGYKHTEDARKKISENNAGKRPINQLDINGVFIKEWECGKHASIALNINHNTIYRCAKGHLKKAGNFKWEYKI